MSSLITFDGLADGDANAPTDLTFAFYAPDHALIPGLDETYTISLVATAITTGVASSPATFDLPVYDPCQYATITFAPTVFTDFTYTLWDNTHPNLAWTDATAA